MAAGDTTITMIGNLVDDPELRFTPSGAAVAKFRVASTPRYLDKQTNEWKDGESLFLQCQIWRQAAENVVSPAGITISSSLLVESVLNKLFWANYFGAQNCFIQIELAIQLFDCSWFAVHIDDCINTFAFFRNFKRHTTTAPQVELVDGSTAVFDDLEICF